MMIYTKKNIKNIHKNYTYFKIFNICLHKIRKNPILYIKYLNTIFYLNINSVNVYKKIRKNPQRIHMY